MIVFNRGIDQPLTGHEPGKQMALGYGPVIRVNGKQPDWIDQEDTIFWMGTNMVWSKNPVPVKQWTKWSWANVVDIRLPVNHPRYNSKRESLGEDLVERMKELVHEMASSDIYGCHFTEARAIAAKLDPHMDPVEEAFTTLDVFLSAYGARPDDELVTRVLGDDLLTWGHLRTILAARA